MKIGALICRVSRELYLRSYQNTKPRKLASSITQYQPCYSNSTIISYTYGNRAQQHRTYIAANVKVTSREMIKPSSLNPNQNKSVYLSLLDQITPNVYNTMILFYQNDPHKNDNYCNHLFNTTEKRTKLLKQSLSEVLVDFYPLAGRIQRNELIECNHEGVEFCEANISDKNLTQYIENPSVVDLQALLPFIRSEPRHKNIVLSVQVNHFRCGAMALGVCATHKITDGMALIDFINAWSKKTRHPKYIVTPPNFNGASFFPPSKELNDLIIKLPVSEERTAVRRLLFDKKTIQKMKVEAESTVFRPTTNEVVAAFIWRHLTKFSSALQFANLRTKMAPPIPMNFFGNFTYFAVASSSSPCIIDELRKSVKKINSDYIHDIMINDKSLMKLKKHMHEVYGMPENNLYFTNISRLSVYEADFGLGKPIWTCFPSSSSLKNMSLVMSTPCGEGVEVWICMLEDDIAMLDHSLSNLPSPTVKHVSVD